MSDKENHDEKAHKKHGGHGPPHGGHEEGHEGAPEWLISFADNVTLMMGFFVILLAVNMGPKGAGAGDAARSGDSDTPPPALLDAQIAIREAFNNPVNLNSMNPGDRVLVQRLLERRGKSVAHQDGPRGDEHSLQSIRPSDYHKLCGAVRFDRNSSELTEEARATVVDVAAHVRGLRMMIDVRGHASARESFERADHGMALSFERAITVARLLTQHEVDWRQIRIVSVADNDRIKPLVYEPMGHADNERVEIVLTDEVMPDYAPTSAPASPLRPAKVRQAHP